MAEVGTMGVAGVMAWKAEVVWAVAGAVVMAVVEAEAGRLKMRRRLSRLHLLLLLLPRLLCAFSQTISSWGLLLLEAAVGGGEGRLSGRETRG